MWQELIVGVIGAAVAAKLLYHLYSFFFVKKKHGGSACSSCGSCVHAAKK